MTPTKLAEYFLWMIASVFLLITAVFGRYFTYFKGDLSTEHGDWGTFGDYIGGTLNPILSFLSLIALLATIVLQSKELKLTRKELKRSASAQVQTKEILDKQSETLTRQQFESTFFSLLDQHNQVLYSFRDAILAGEKYSKLAFIRHIIFKMDISGDKPETLEDAKKILDLHNAFCGHYFLTLYQVLKFIATNSPGTPIGKSFDSNKIDNKPVSDDEKMYSNIVRAVLGIDVTQLLSINCYCKDHEDSYWMYKLLIERYAFLEHMSFEIDTKLCPLLKKTENFYKESAFGNNIYLEKNNRK
ncbi:MAG: putative phage abortive infection protein [Methylomicrobium sp.]